MNSLVLIFIFTLIVWVVVFVAVVRHKRSGRPRSDSSDAGLPAASGGVESSEAGSSGHHHHHHHGDTGGGHHHGDAGGGHIGGGHH